MDLPVVCGSEIVPNTISKSKSPLSIQLADAASGRYCGTVYAIGSMTANGIPTQNVVRDLGAVINQHLDGLAPNPVDDIFLRDQSVFKNIVSQYISPVVDSWGRAGRAKDVLASAPRQLVQDLAVQRLDSHTPALLQRLVDVLDVALTCSETGAF